MRKTLIAVMAMVTMFWFTSPTHATLIDRGGGLIYDDVKNITWLQDANYAATQYLASGGTQGDADGLMSWQGATAWAGNLVYGGYSDWRLPTTVDGLYSWGYNGTTTAGSNITTSEMGYMYYVNLANKGYYDTSGNAPQSGWGLINTVPFLNLQPQYYWSGTGYSSDPLFAWVFHFGAGVQAYGHKDHDDVYAWAVRDGDVAAVPEPSLMVLLGISVMSLVGLRRCWKD